MQSVHETLIAMLFLINVIAVISFVAPEGPSWVYNEFPQEGLALKPSDFLKFRHRLFQAPVVWVTALLLRLCAG